MGFLEKATGVLSNAFGPAAIIAYAKISKSAKKGIEGETEQIETSIKSVDDVSYVVDECDEDILDNSLESLVDNQEKISSAENSAEEKYQKVMDHINSAESAAVATGPLNPGSAGALVFKKTSYYNDLQKAKNECEKAANDAKSKISQSQSKVNRQKEKIVREKVQARKNEKEQNNNTNNN